MRKLRRSGRGRYRSRLTSQPGERFRSGLENRIITDLEHRGIAYEYEPITFSFYQSVRGGKCADCGSRKTLKKRKYTPDLVFGTAYIEIKGKLDGTTRTRMEGFLESPEGRGIDLRFIFQRDNWITKKHKHRYSDWCKKLGLKFHIGEEVPESWI